MFSTFATLLGVILIILGLRDVFHQLFHPSGAGSVSGILMKAVWRVFRRLVARRYRSLLALAGPSALVAVIASWVVLLAVGFALLYWPRLPGGFAFATALDPWKEGGFIDALYLSLVTLATLVHVQMRRWLMGYPSRYETTYIRASLERRRARGLEGGLAFVGCLHPAPLSDFARQRGGQKCLPDRS